jgi:hypothetical protein
MELFRRQEARDVSWAKRHPDVGLLHGLLLLSPFWLVRHYAAAARAAAKSFARQWSGAALPP